MGRLCGLVLVVAAACGDNLAGPSKELAGPSPGRGDSYGTVPARYAPEVCGAHQLTPTIGADPASVLAVAPQVGGAAVVAVPTAGGTLAGFTVDAAMDLATVGGKLPLDDTFTAASIASIRGRPVAAGLDAMHAVAKIALVGADLSSAVEIAKLPATSIAQPMMVLTQGERVVPYATAGGVAMAHFNGAWQMDGTVMLATTEPARDVTASAYGDIALVAWTTPTACYVSNVSGFAPGYLSTVSVPCNKARIAGDTEAGYAVLVFEAPDGVRIADAMHMAVVDRSVVLRADAREPRALYDGQRFWVSYLDARGDVAVGFLDRFDHLISTELAGIRPQARAYDLVLIDGAPWVVAVDADNGFTAHELCVVPQ
jgi:hypothetical protein